MAPGVPGIAAFEAILSSESEDDIFEHGADTLAEIVDSTVSIYSHNDRNELVLRSTTDSGSGEHCRTIPLSTRSVDRAVRKKETVVIDDCSDTRSQTSADTAGTSHRSVMLVPIADEGVAVAVDEVANAFSDHEAQMSELFSTFLAAILKNGVDRSEPDIAEQRLERIASILSHDLGSPLTIGRHFVTESIQSGDVTDLDYAVRAFDRIDEITSGLETYARTGQTVQEIQPVHLRECALDAWSMIETEGASIEIESSRILLADEHRVHQLLENLFSNAVSHGGSDVVVRVGILEDGSGMFIEDDGDGIPEDISNEIFEYGYSTADHHSGFGLSIVDGIVEGHGWEINLTSNEEGGARFEITGIEFR